MYCLNCAKEVKKIQTVNGKCLDCWRIKAVETVKAYKEKFGLEAQKFKELKVDKSHKFGQSKWTLFLLQLKSNLFKVGETILDKAIDKTVGKFSWIIGIVLVILIAGAFYKALKRKS